MKSCLNVSFSEHILIERIGDFKKLNESRTIVVFQDSIMIQSMRAKFFFLGILFPVFLLVTVSIALGQSGNAGVVSGENVPKQVAESVVLEAGKESFTIEQMASIYARNSGRSGKSFFELNKDTALEFLNIYANYRLKVQRALAEGFDKLPEVQQEIAASRVQVAIPPAPATGYLLERKLVDSVVREIFKRRDEEIKVAVIYSAMNPENPNDTLRAYQLTQKMLDSLKQGLVDFTTMALNSSDDPTTKKKGGEIGWITGGMVIRPIENAAFVTPANQLYPDVISVNSGYVLLKVLDRSERIRVRPAHLLFTAASTDIKAVGDASAQAKENAEHALERLKNGDDFETVAREMSSDKVSAEYGGDLMAYYTRSLGFESRPGKLVPEFETALFELEDGEISDIVKTEFGYHIIKRLESNRPTFEEEEEMIRKMYKERFLQLDRQKFVENLLDQYGLTIDHSTLHQLLGKVDQNRTTADSSWNAQINSELRSKTLWTLFGKKYSVADLMDSIETKPELRATALTEKRLIVTIKYLMEPAALMKAADGLEKEYPEFAQLMQEFRDGSLVFKLEEQHVFNKMKFDEEEGKKFFEQHRGDYKSQPVIGISEIFLYKENEVEDIYKKVKESSVPFDTLAAEFTQRQGYRQRAGRWTPSTPKNADLVRRILERHPDLKEGDILDPIEYQAGWSIIRINSVEAPKPLTFEEARSEVMGDYMDYLDKQLKSEFTMSLRQKYPVKINEKVLSKALATTK